MNSAIASHIVPKGTKTADGALQLLVAVVHCEEPPTLRELVTSTGIEENRAYRLLRMLEQGGFLIRNQRRMFEPGAQLVAMSARVVNRLGVAAITRPVLERIAHTTGETASLHVVRNDMRVCIDGVESTQPVRRVVDFGAAVPLHAGPTGKVILAFLPPEEAERLLGALEGLGKKRQQIRHDMRRAQSDGYLVTVGDRNPGVGGLSAPIFGPAGVVGAITVAGPAERWNATRQQEYAEMLRDEAAAISHSLGGSFPTLDEHLAG